MNDFEAEEWSLGIHLIKGIFSNEDEQQKINIQQNYANLQTCGNS